MTNQFFKIALAQATRLAGKPGRLLQLVAQLLHRLYKTDRRQLSLKGLSERLQTFGRLVNSYARGHYREIPLKTIIKIIAALIYFLNPIDLIPDAIVGIGFIDDLAVLTGVYKSAQDELDSFIEWEKNRAII
ncbi:hypothetical protein BH10BAC4_BH10BAC4_15400 [soil metagenome]